MSDLFSLSALAPAGITSSLSSNQLLLAPGATRPFTVTLETGDYSAIEGGVYDITVEAVSDYDALVREAVVDRVEVINYTLMLPVVLKHHQ